jgi:hypothetical protein
MLSVILDKCCHFHFYAECRNGEYHYAECRYTECRYTECRYAECRDAGRRVWVNFFMNGLTGPER